MMAKSKLSVGISKATKKQLDRYAKAHGLKKNHLVEQALLHKLQALRELPTDITDIPPRLMPRVRRSKR